MLKAARGRGIAPQSLPRFCHESNRIDLIETDAAGVRTRGITRFQLTSIAIGAISNPSVSALKMPDQRLFRSDTATKSAISAMFSMWLALSNPAVLRDSAERSAHCELLGAWLRLLKGETERANPSVSSPTRRTRSGARFRSLCSRRRRLSSRCPHRHVVSSDRVEVVDRELEREE